MPAAAATPAADTIAGGDSLRLAADSLTADSAARLERMVATAPARDYLAEVRANFTPENRAYANTKVVLTFVEPVLGLLLMVILLFSGVSARLRDVAHQFGHRRYVRVLVYFTLFMVLVTALSLPLSWYWSFALEHQYGLSNETFGSWLADEAKALGLTILGFGVIPIVALAYRALERHPRRWWLWLAAGSVPVIVASFFLQPLVVDPVFNRFTSLEDPVLKQEILDLAARAGIPAHDVLQVNKSAQTRKYNAYVTGIGPSQRIVLWDTMLHGMKRDEILFVMAHEMGHYRLNHIWAGIAYSCALSFLLFFLAGQIVARTLRRFGEAWDVRAIHDVATLPLFAIVLSLLSLLAQPATAAFSRQVEHDADVFALEVTRTNDAGARSFLQLGSQNRSDPEPSPFVRAVLYDHPPLAERIRFALAYRPWERGAPNRLFHEAP